MTLNARAMKGKCQHVTISGPILGARLLRLPAYIGSVSMRWVSRIEKGCPPEERILFPQGYAFPEKTKQVCVLFTERPVNPANFVVLAPAVVVSLPASGKFIAGGNHRDPLGQKEQGSKGANTPETEALYVRRTRNPLMPAVPAQVMGFTVTVLFTIIVIAFVFIAHQIVEGKAIVAGDKVY